MRHIFLLMAALCVLLLSGCSWYTAPVMPPGGFIFADIKAPIDTDANKTTVASKSGDSSSMSILGLIAIGDASVTAAAKEAGIKEIDHVDYEYLNVLFVYQKFTTRVYGE